MGLYGVYCFDSGGGCAGLLRREFTIFRQEQYGPPYPYGLFSLWQSPHPKRTQHIVEHSHQSDNGMYGVFLIGGRTYTLLTYQWLNMRHALMIPYPKRALPEALLPPHAEASYFPSPPYASPVPTLLSSYHSLQPENSA